MLNKFNNVFSKGGDQPGMRSKKIDIISKSDYEYNQAPKVDETVGKCYNQFLIYLSVF